MENSMVTLWCEQYDKLWTSTIFRGNFNPREPIFSSFFCRRKGLTLLQHYSMDVILAFRWKQDEQFNVNQKVWSSTESTGSYGERPGATWWRVRKSPFHVETPIPTLFFNFQRSQTTPWMFSTPQKLLCSVESHWKEGSCQYRNSWFLISRELWEQKNMPRIVSSSRLDSENVTR